MQSKPTKYKGQLVNDVSYSHTNNCRKVCLQGCHIIERPKSLDLPTPATNYPLLVLAKKGCCTTYKRIDIIPISYQKYDLLRFRCPGH